MSLKLAFPQLHERTQGSKGCTISVDKMVPFLFYYFFCIGRVHQYDSTSVTSPQPHQEPNQFAAWLQSES